MLPGETREDQADRLDAAVALCRSCPALTPCGELLDADGPGPGVGVMAGRIVGRRAHRTRTGRAA